MSQFSLLDETFVLLINAAVVGSPGSPVRLPEVVVLREEPSLFLLYTVPS